MKNLEPKAAFDFLQQNPGAILVDIRSEIEHYFVGHPPGAIHIAWSDGPNWEVDPQRFVPQVKSATGGEDRPVVLICRSGNRTVDAGREADPDRDVRHEMPKHGFVDQTADGRDRFLAGAGPASG